MRSLLVLTVTAYLAVLVSATHPADAQNTVFIPPDAINEQDAPGVALVDAFARFCLTNFPEPARVEDGAPGKLTPLSRDRVRDFLKEDPGRGWIYRADGGEYVLTVEDPPYHTCAVRRLYTTPPRYRLPFLLMTGTWAAAANRGPFQDVPPQTTRRDNLVVEATGRILHGGPDDVFLELRTTYPNGRVELRLARRVIGR